MAVKTYDYKVYYTENVAWLAELYAPQGVGLGVVGSYSEGCDTVQ